MTPLALCLSCVCCCVLCFWSQPVYAAQDALVRSAAVPEQTTAAPDLVITAITLTPPNPGAGDTADIHIMVKNQGDGPTTSAFTVYLYVEPATVPPTQSTPAVTNLIYGLALPPGGVFTFTRTGQTFTNANPQLYAWVDPPWENQVAEANENNNLFPAPTNPGSPDAYENDDTCANAKASTTDGAEQQRNLFRNPGPDSDWIKFNGVSGVTYVAEAIAVGKDADVSLELHATCDGPSNASGAKLEFTISANGVYYLKVVPNQVDYGSDNAYRFKITGNTGCQEIAEVNNLCAQAGNLALGVAQKQNFCKANDVDWVQFPVQAGVAYTITGKAVGPNADPQLGIFDHCNNALSTNVGQTLHFTAVRNGTAYVKAKNNEPNRFGAGTEYTLRVDGANGTGCLEDAFEQDDNQEQAHSITVNADAQTHHFCPPGDQDWVKFAAEAEKTYNIETLNLAKDSDTKICLFDAQRKRLACDDDSGANKGSRLIWQAPVSGNYFLNIEDVDPNVAGPDTQYAVHVIATVCTGDAQEPDNGQTAARWIAMDGTLQQHNICPAGDEDWVKFDATANIAYVMETTAIGADADTMIELYDANGNKLAQNDDHEVGGNAQVAYTVQTTGVYYVNVHHFNPTKFGAGTEYALRVQPGTPTPTPSPSPTPSPTATPTTTPVPSNVHALILVNRERIAQLYSDNDASQLMDKLATLAVHPQVQGEVLQLDQNHDIAAAYATWLGDLTDVDKANAVTSAVRAVIMGYLQQHSGVEYVVLVGDDRALPFRRIADNTTQSPENTYPLLASDHPTGAALRANYFLSDDYYVDKVPTPYNGRELYLPDLAIGRLIETPAEMMGVIDAFLTKPVTVAPSVLVSGYDFVEDTANGDCQDWQTDLGANQVNCSLIGANHWTGQDLRALQLRTSAPFLIQSISGHANHYAEGVPTGEILEGHEVFNSAMDLSGGLIYTPGCHAGLNVPPTNINPIDLPEAFLSKHANYIGNTGYGWGMLDTIGLSEKLVRLYTQTLLKEGQASMGQSLTVAKKLYYQQVQGFSPFDEKVVEQMTFYGLPMRQLHTGAALGADDPFPGVKFTPPSLALDGAELMIAPVAVDFKQALSLETEFTLVHTANGDYYALDNSVQTVPGQPIQPLHFGNVTTNKPAHGVIIRSATFITKPNFNIAIATPYNEYVQPGQMKAADLPAALAWYPAVPVTVQTLNGKSTLLTQQAQYNPASQQLRIYEDLHLEVFYSDSADQTPPTITLLDSLYYPSTGWVEVKVDAEDPSGIQQVTVAYTPDASVASAQFTTVDLAFDVITHKWRGLFSGHANTKYAVYVVDKAGNVSVDNHKGEHYSPASATTAPACGVNIHCLFLPTVRR